MFLSVGASGKPWAVQALKGLQERNECLLIRGRQPHAKLVTFHGMSLFRTFEPGRPIIVPEAALVKPVLKCSHGPVVLEWSAIPDSLEGRHFVIPRAPSGLHREAGIRAHNDGQNVVGTLMLFRNAKPSCRVLVQFDFGKNISDGSMW